MVSRYVTEVLVTKREAELTLDEQKFGEKKLIQKRKELIIGGMEPEEVLNKYFALILFRSFYSL